MLTKPQKVVLSFFAAVILIIAILAIIAFSPKNQNPTLNISSSELIFYYGITCPHCKIVEEWMTINNVTQKLNITQKEVYLNSTNAQELIAVGKSCNLQKSYIGAVPLLYTNKTCHIGDTPIIEFLKTKIGVQ